MNAKRALLLTIAIASLTMAATFGGGGMPQEVELDEAEVFIEWNSTDGDYGIQFFWDGEPWKRMRVENSAGKKVLDVRVRRNLRQQGMTEGFFESAEPDTSVLSLAQFFQRFPEGEYEFEGVTLGNDELEGETDFTHVLPAPPANLSPASGAEVSAAAPLTVSFDAVTQDTNGQSLTPVRYEVILETEGGGLERIFSVILDGAEPNPSVTIPPQFLTPGAEYKYEVIAQEPSGNKTITEIEFSTL